MYQLRCVLPGADPMQHGRLLHHTQPNSKPLPLPFFPAPTLHSNRPTGVSDCNASTQTTSMHTAFPWQGEGNMSTKHIA